jgi:ATP-binding cassette subfamily B multidrug efflux pump
MKTELLDIGRLPATTKPPEQLWPFIWHFVRQLKWLLPVLVVLEASLAVFQAFIPVMLGWITNALLANPNNPAAVLEDPWLWQLGAPSILGYSAAVILAWYIYDHHYTPRFNNLIRFQLTHYTLGQSLTYYQNDFAGRIASKVMEGGAVLRDPLRAVIGSVWYAGLFAVTCVGILLANNVWLAVVPILWLMGYVGSLVYFVPKVKYQSLLHTRVHTQVVGQVNDIFANILPIKLFGREKYEDTRTLDLLEEHSQTQRASLHKVWQMTTTITILNALMLIIGPWVALQLWAQGSISAGAVITAIPMFWQIINQSGWIRNEVTRIFEDLGRIEECMETISKPYSVTDAPDAQALVVQPGGGAVRFEHITFNYGKGAMGENGVLHNLNLSILAGQKVGLVGRSGAGKSTLVNLLLRFYDLESGTITIDGQNISCVTQASLRQHIGMVTQEAQLMHRSVADNIRLGKPEATDAEVIAAATRAHAHDFILKCEDKYGNKGYAALVGERGVKLSGGQRQRIAIARMILERAPILLLDEATSALDSEVEAAIQEEMTELMKGKTTIAIAHRLSTIAQMDRLVVMDKGQIVEDGTHTELLARGGIYADLWNRQSGGFIGHD